MYADYTPPLDERIFQQLLAGEAAWAKASDPDLVDAYAAHQKLEGLFNVLRLPSQYAAQKNAPALCPGMKLGDFTLVRSLGAGGMGTVFLARQESLQRFVAVKICKPEIAHDPLLRERFQNEAQILAQLRHNNIVPVHSSGVDRGHPYLAMEYIHGPTLADILHALRRSPHGGKASHIVTTILQGQGIPSSEWTTARPVELDAPYVEWLVGVLHKVALALAVVHASGLIHLDLKPSNIVFDGNGEPKVVDFGLAIAAPALRQQTTGKGFFGTPEYASPEQLSGTLDQCSSESDIFSFGVLLYECLSLRRPFEGRSVAELAQNVIGKQPFPLRQANPRIQWELEALSHKCLEKRSGRRYRNGAHLAKDVSNLIDARPLEAKSTILRRLRYWAGIHPQGAGVCGFLLVILVFVAVGLVLAPVKGSTRKQFLQIVDRGDCDYLLSNLARFAGNSPSERQESQQSAIANYTTALESQSKCVWLLTQRGLLYLDSPDTLPVALSDFRAAAARKPHRASIHRLLAVTLERLGNTEAAAIEQNRARQIYPTTAEDLYWLGHIALYLDGDARTASAFWANCLLIEPESYSGAKDNRTINAPGYNLHFLARVQRALCTGMRDAETQTELRLAAQLSPRLAELCGLNEIAQAMKPPAASTAKQ